MSTQQERSNNILPVAGRPAVNVGAEGVPESFGESKLLLEEATDGWANAFVEDGVPSLENHFPLFLSANNMVSHVI